MCRNGSDHRRSLAAAGAAFDRWRRIPCNDRVQYLFKLKNLLEENLETIARTITEECGKTYEESVGKMRRAIENVEVACGIPSLIQGYNNEEIAPGIDEHMFRQPLGVVATIAPFNFPAMVPFWFMPYAVACDNCFILKPSEKTPMAGRRVFELWEQTGIPAGVVQLVNGGRETVDALLQHDGVRAISFVGSSPVARRVYQQATAHGKRAQCQGGAKNPVVVMPDADMEMAGRIVADSSFGCAGQRCLASSLVIGVAAPMAFFPFTGWKDSFFGDLHGQGRHAVEFFTQTKVVVERWPRQWSRKF